MASLPHYPPAGFHFRVVFQLLPDAQETRFQEVAGLSVDVPYESWKEGGENRFEHRLPGRTTYADLVLRRGLLPGSAVYRWAQNAFENFEFLPLNLLVSLLNDQHQPLLSWNVVHALPKRWEVSAFNAEQNAVVVETLTLSYRYFNTLQ